MGEASLRQIEDLIGSSLILASAIRRVVEQSALREAVGDELTESQLKLLRLLSLSESHSLGEVSAFLGVSNAAASKAVDKLVGRMLLRRTEGESDRRSIRLTLTEPARRILTAYDAAVHRKLKEVFGHFSAEELVQATEILDCLTGRIVGNCDGAGEVCLQCGMYFPERCVREKAGAYCGYLSRKGRNKTVSNGERKAGP